MYYGLAASRERIFVGCRNHSDGPSEERVRETEAGSILVFDRGLRLVGELEAPFRMRDLHGISYFDGKLWVTCAYDNFIAVYDTAERTWTKWYPAPDPGHRDRDVHHFNSVAAFNGHVYVMAHNFGKSQLLVFSRASRDLCRVIELGSQAHDVFVVNGQLAACDSGAGVLRSSSGWVLRTGGFPRGIGFGPRSILLGISERTSRPLRAASSSIVRQYGKDWQHRSDFILKGAGMITSIQPVLPGTWQPASYEKWANVMRCFGYAEEIEPANVYLPGATDGFGPDWHRGEGEHRWMAALQARMNVVINPGETRLAIEASSYFPGLYRTRVMLNGTLLGPMEWRGPGDATAEFTLPGGNTGPSELEFRVPHLWQPSSTIEGAADQRALGIAVRAVRLLRGFPSVAAVA